MSSRSLAGKVGNVQFPDLAACGQPALTPLGLIPFPFLLALGSASCPLLGPFTDIPFLPSHAVVRSQDLSSGGLGLRPASALPGVCDLCVVLSLGLPICRAGIPTVPCA